MSSELYPKEFEKTAEVLPFSKYGLSTFSEFKKAEEDIKNLEKLKKAGLTDDELKLYLDNESGKLEKYDKMESEVLKIKLKEICNKLDTFQQNSESSTNDDDKPSTSQEKNNDAQDQISIQFYPDGHPMNHIKELERDLFGHLNDDEMLPITKRRKMLRRLERKKERILSQDKQSVNTVSTKNKIDRPNSLWDVKKQSKEAFKHSVNNKSKIYGPHSRTMYTIKNAKIVRLEPNERSNEYRAVDIVMPVNPAEQQLLEGTKMCIDDIKKIERFKDYDPGKPSKVLYLKNIAPSVSQEQVSLLFNQFVLANGGPVDLRLMSGRMRGQAFVAFQHEHLAIQALEEVNGTILSGQPVIAQFGRNTNRIQDDDR